MVVWTYFIWQALSSLSVSGFLTLRGAHLCARSQTVQLLALSQFTIFFGLLSIGVGHLFLPLDEAVSLATILNPILCFGCWKVVDSHRNAWKGSSESFLLTVFLTFMALSYALSVAFPILESHFKLLFFGDIATLDSKTAKILLLVSSGALGIEWGFFKKFASFSFIDAVLKTNAGSNRRIKLKKSFRADQVYDETVSVLILIVCIQNLGILFTLGAALLAPVILSRSKKSDLLSYRNRMISTTLIGVGIGFGLSMQLPMWPTVPLMVLCVGVMVGLFQGSQALRGHAREQT